VDGFCCPVLEVLHCCHGHQADCPPDRPPDRRLDRRLDRRPDYDRPVPLIRVARQLKAVHRIRFVRPKPSVRPSHYGCAGRMSLADFRLDCADHLD